MTFITATEFFAYYEKRDQEILESFNQTLLKACPFCGGQCVLIPQANGLRAGLVIFCNGCRVQVRYGFTRRVIFEQPGEKKAHYINRPDFSATLDAWNTRAEKMKPVLPSQLLEFVEAFAKNYKQQDNRGTAWPYAYVVQKKITRLVPEDYGDKAVYRLPDDEDGTPFTEDEVEDMQEEHWKAWKIDLEECDRIGDYEEDWEDVQWFFTKEEAEGYLSRDKHNLGETRTYVKYFNRNSEAENILRVMFELAGTSYEQAKRK